MGNQLLKDKSANITNSSIENISDSELFSNNNDRIDSNNDLWKNDNISKSEKSNLSSFTSAEVKIIFTIAQSDYTSNQPHSTISVQTGERLKFKAYSPDKQWVIIEKLDSRESGWIPANIISEFIEESQESDSYLQQFNWYHGAIPRSFAEYLLNSGITGSFLVRESESNRRLRSISLRYEGKIWHFRISKDYNNKYYVTENQRFETINQLIDYHSKYADGLPCQLRFPAPKRAQATVFGVGENDSADIWEINRTEIMMKQQLGSGQYGIVYEAFWTRFSITVAVKTVKADVTVADDFLEEARLMKNLQHPNLVRLLGVCTQEPPNYIITEFMENGNLLDYLRTKSKEDLPPPVLLYMAIQIAAGMAYLEKQNFIHRDLAARNCLVGQDNIVKVADFGLARCMERDDTYTAHVGAKFPIKWTAPEGLAFNVFSTKSDVWAFGVLLWELATYGMTPYPGIELQDVYVYLEKKNIMCRPAGCPDNIYELMKQCWQFYPENRPTFKELHSDLEKLLSNINEQIDLEIAKESSSRNDCRKSRVSHNNLIDDALPSPPNHEQLFAQTISNTSKRKSGPPAPPVRTTPPVRSSPLKELSLTGSFTISTAASIMEESIIEEDPPSSHTSTSTTVANSDIGDHHDNTDVDADDEFLPLPPPEDLLTKNFDSLSLPPPILMSKPRSAKTDLFPKPSTTSFGTGSNSNALASGRSAIALPPSSQSASSSSSAANHHSQHRQPHQQFSYLSLPKQQSGSKIPQNLRRDHIKRVKSDQAVLGPEKDFQSELRSRLKLQQSCNSDSTHRTGPHLPEEPPVQNVSISNSWATRKSLGHIRVPAVDGSGTATTSGDGLLHSQSTTSGSGNVSMSNNSKRMSWTGGLSSQASSASSTNKKPLSVANACPEECSDPDDEFLSRDRLLSEFGSITRELTALAGPTGSLDVVSGLVEKLETLHLGSTRYGNSAISAAKIKFKFIEQCTSFSHAIEALRKQLKPPYSHSALVSSSQQIRAIVSDLRNLIENS